MNQVKECQRWTLDTIPGELPGHTRHSPPHNTCPAPSPRLPPTIASHSKSASEHATTPHSLQNLPDPIDFSTDRGRKCPKLCTTCGLRWQNCEATSLVFFAFNCIATAAAALTARGTLRAPPVSPATSSFLV